VNALHLAAPTAHGSSQIPVQATCAVLVMNVSELESINLICQCMQSQLLGQHSTIMIAMHPNMKRQHVLLVTYRDQQ